MLPEILRRFAPRWRAELRVEQLGFYFFTFARLVRIPLRGVLELIG